MYLNNKRKIPNTKLESIYEMEARLRAQAIAISKAHQDTKPIKYLLKR